MLKLVGLGLFAGLMGGLLGIGGGVVIVPGLVFLMGFNQHRAHGTSLFSALFLAVVGLWRYASDGNVDFALAAVIAAGGVVGAMLGARVAGAMKSATLRKIFAAFLFVVSARMILTGLSGASGQAGHGLVAAGGPAYWCAALGTGIVTGFVSGLFGVGGGTIMIPAMVLLMAVGQKVAQGVSLAAMIPTAISGVMTHRRLGNVDFGVGKWTGLGAALGALSGATLASRLDNHILQFVFAGFIAFVAVTMGLRKQG